LKITSSFPKIIVQRICNFQTVRRIIQTFLIIGIDGCERKIEISIDAGSVLGIFFCNYRKTVNRFLILRESRCGNRNENEEEENFAEPA